MPTPTPQQTAPQATVSALEPKSRAEQGSMSFPAAIQKVKDGLKVRRPVWPEDHYMYLAQQAEMTGEKGSDPGYLAQHHPNGKVDCIFFNLADVEADDWEVYVQ